MLVHSTCIVGQANKVCEWVGWDGWRCQVPGDGRDSGMLYPKSRGASTLTTPSPAADPLSPPSPSPPRPPLLSPLLVRSCRPDRAPLCALVRVTPPPQPPLLSLRCQHRASSAATCAAGLPPPTAVTYQRICTFARWPRSEISYARDAVVTYTRARRRGIEGPRKG